MLTLEEIEFGEKQFRNLKDIKIPIAKGITVIAGHNGIGKSTILGLIANCSGEQKVKSLFGKTFRSDFQEIFHLDYHYDYEVYLKENKSTMPKVYLKYNYQDICNYVKSCSVSVEKQGIETKNYKNHMVKVEKSHNTIHHQIHNKKNLQFNEKEDKVDFELPELKTQIWRLRIIPRTVNISLRTKNSVNEKNSQDPSALLELERLNKIDRSGSAKVPVPTIYLGMGRMTPIGEFSEDRINRKINTLQKDDIEFIINIFKNIFPNFVCEEKIIKHSFVGSKKGSCIPSVNYDSFSISLGQDSISTIITALASFYQLKKTRNAEYTNGILIIDEVESGLHPRAQQKLIRELYKYSKSLNIQIILTTHSLSVIEEVLELNNHPGQTKLNSVSYLMDTKHPRLMLQPTFEKIKKDMLALDSIQTEIKQIKIYFEDDEALYFFKEILKFKELSINNFNKNEIKLISLNIGCDTLLKLYKKDDYFNNVIIIPDNDTVSKKSYLEIIENSITICPLPGNESFNQNTKSTLRSPEKILYNYLENKVNDNNFIKSLDTTSDFIKDRVLSLDKRENQKERDKYKNWFKEKKKYIEEYKLIESWCKENKGEIDNFIYKLENAIAAIKNKI